MNFDHVDIDLLRRYNEPGPRYTSYPTAPLFNEALGPSEFESAIVETNGDGAPPLSLYVHLPFCDTLCYFCGCTMMVTQKEDKKANYLDYLEREIIKISDLVADDRKVMQLHWGGGTPTSHSPEQIEWLGNLLRERFRFAGDEAEVSCELDPRELTREHVEALRNVGFNRISMGVQDFEHKVQEAVNRIQPEDMTRDVVKWTRELGFHSVNIDFMYGLPHQTVKTFEQSLDTLIDVAPDRIAVFNFAYVPWLKKHHQQLIDPETLPSAEERLEILKLTIEKLCSSGYTYIGMDHFARPDDELTLAQERGTLHRNFQGYSTKAGCDLYAFGMSGISMFDEVYAQNHKGLPEYYDAIDAGKLATKSGYRLDADDRIRREVITRLMCDFAIDKSRIENQFGIEFDSYFAQSITKLQRFVDDGLVVPTDGGFEITQMGRLVIRNVAMCFDRYLDEMRSEKPLFSRTV